MTRYVIDAAIAIKWVVEEVGTAEALALRRHRLLAPDLLIAECANVLWKKVHRQELRAEEARLAASLIERADVELMPMRRLLETATALAIRLGHPADDCVYLVLAEQAGCSFVTADRRFCMKVADRLLPGQVVHLNDASG